MALDLAETHPFVLTDLILHTQSWASDPKENVWVRPTSTFPPPLGLPSGQRTGYNDINWLELHETSLFNSQTPGFLFCFVFNFQTISLCPAGFHPSPPLSPSIFISYFPLAAFRQRGRRNSASQGALSWRHLTLRARWKYFTLETKNWSGWWACINATSTFWEERDFRVPPSCELS